MFLVYNIHIVYKVQLEVIAVAFSNLLSVNWFRVIGRARKGDGEMRTLC